MASSDQQLARTAPSLSPLTLRELSDSLPPTIPLVLSSRHDWDPVSCSLKERGETKNDEPAKMYLVPDALELLRTIHKPLGVLAICGPYRSGKSYLLSRLMGRPGVFKLGHSPLPCTHGVWMATTVLECQDFAVLLLDTEGLDAVGASETEAAALLTLTSLLSSFLIYNSTKVPRQADLRQLHCFSQLSSSLLSQAGQQQGERQAAFPHFLWVLRDVSLRITNTARQTISATEYLMTRVLASSETGQPTELGRSLQHLFPSLQCHTLPIPTANPKFIENIVECQEQLRPKFNSAVKELQGLILQQLGPKLAPIGGGVVDGPALAQLAMEYVAALNTPGAVPDLQQSWLAAVRLKLQEAAQRLAKEYGQEMEASLSDNLPMEEASLWRVHTQTMRRKMAVLENEVQQLNPLSAARGDRDLALGQLEQAIIQTNEGGNVVGGTLLQYTSRNLSQSLQFCEQVWRETLEASGIQQKCQEAYGSSQPLEVGPLLEVAEAQYWQRAKGPAAKEVLFKGCRNLECMVEMVRKIPGAPQDLKIIGRSQDKVKLSWQPPKENPETAEEYKVWRRRTNKKGEEKQWEWECVGTTKKTRFLVTGLKYDFEFSVSATNEWMRGLIRDDIDRPHKFLDSKADRRAVIALAALVGGLGGPHAILLSSKALQQKDDDDAIGYIIAAGLSGLLTLGFNLLIAPVTVPIGAIWGAKVVNDERTFGDLTPE